MRPHHSVMGVFALQFSRKSPASWSRIASKISQSSTRPGFSNGFGTTNPPTVGSDTTYPCPHAATLRNASYQPGYLAASRSSFPSTTTRRNLPSRILVYSTSRRESPASSSLLRLATTAKRAPSADQAAHLPAARASTLSSTSSKLTTTTSPSAEEKSIASPSGDHDRLSTHMSDSPSDHTFRGLFHRCPA